MASRPTPELLILWLNDGVGLSKLGQTASESQPAHSSVLSMQVSQDQVRWKAACVLRLRESWKIEQLLK
jgi:hypothetical protein